MEDELTNSNFETGVETDLPVLSISTPDRDLISNFKRWIQEAERYWDDPKGFNLSNKRKRNKAYYLGRQIDEDQLYSYQVPFVQNELFVATETIAAYTTSGTPSAEVRPQDDTVQSKVMADDLEWALNAHSEKFDLAQKMESVFRNLYLKYIGWIKLRYDSTCEDIVPVVVDPDRIIVDKSCKEGDNPLFICEKCIATVQQLMNMFPEKKDVIMEAMGRKRSSSKLQSTVVDYNEVWFTEFKDGEETECVAWYYNDIILDKKKNPNFLYDEDGTQITNFLPKPMKPYIPFNYMNDGTHVIDNTSPFEQAIPIQDILNKRGRQITENADTANSLLVLKAGTIPTEEAENITRDPNQILVLTDKNDRPISDAFGTIDPHLLPAYVLNDKEDLKNTIHSIMGTPAQFRGEDGRAGTLGEAQMLRSQASGRQDAIIRALERGLDLYYKMLVQMMKVWYDSPRKFSSKDNDGKFVYVELKRERIPDVAYVSVEHGTTIKPDKKRQEDIAMSMAKMGLIDPYNLFKDLGLKDADSRYEALVKFKMSPESLTEDIKQDMQDRMAYIDFACIMNGEDVEGHDDVDANHILAHRAQITTDRFLYADRDRQQKMINHIQQEVDLLSQRTKLQEASMQGLLLDPNTPITPEIPEPQPQQPPMMGGAQQPMPMGGEQMLQQQMPQGAPMQGGMASAIPDIEQSQNQMNQQSVLGGLMG